MSMLLLVLGVTAYVGLAVAAAAGWATARRWRQTAETWKANAAMFEQAAYGFEITSRSWERIAKAAVRQRHDEGGAPDAAP